MSGRGWRNERAKKQRAKKQRTNRSKVHKLHKEKKLSCAWIFWAILTLWFAGQIIAKHQEIEMDNRELQEMRFKRD